MQRNYAGFEDKTAAAPAAYDSLVAELRDAAARAGTDAECDSVLRQWIAFFHDGHLSFGRPRAAVGPVQAGVSPDEIRARFADWPRVAVDEEGARALVAAQAARSAAEGIWESGDGSYRVAILRDSTGADLVMSVLRADSVWWMPGQVKAYMRPEGEELATRFFMRDHSEQAWRGSIVGSVLRFQNGSTWLRAWPLEAGDMTPADYRARLNTRFHARELSPGTVLVQIPTFDRPRAIDSLFLAEGERIRGAERLVIDVRGNGGGSDYNYRELLPLLYTHPVRLVSVMALATEDNIRANERLIADTTFPEGQRAQMRSSLERVKASGQRWYAFEDRTEKRTPLARPQRVGVIVDRGCMSSCEQFLFAARESAKTRIYGTNSGGVLDYGNVRRADMPGTTLTIWHPTTRSKRVPAGEGIDGVGIPPDEPIPADAVDPIAWVASRLQAAP